jgi:hypothetical protein
VYGSVFMTEFGWNKVSLRPWSYHFVSRLVYMELGPLEAEFKERRELCDMDGVMEELRRVSKGVTVRTYFLGATDEEDIKCLGQAKC